MAQNMILRRKIEWYIHFLGDDPRKTAHALNELDKIPVSRSWIVHYRLLDMLSDLRNCPRNGWMAQRMFFKYSKIVCDNSPFTPNAEVVRFRFPRPRSDCSSLYTISNASSVTSSASNSPLGIECASKVNGEDTGFGGSTDSVNRSTHYGETDPLLMNASSNSFYDADYQPDTVEETYRLLVPGEVKTKLRRLERIREIVQ